MSKLCSHCIIGIISSYIVNEDELKNILGIPHEVRFVIATPLAYPAEGSYEEAAQERLSQRIRKDLQELVYSNAWGSPF